MRTCDDYLTAPAEKQALASKAILTEVAAAAKLTAYLADVTEGFTYITDPVEAMDFARSTAGLTVYPEALCMDIETQPHPDWIGHPGAGLVPALSLIRLWSIYDPATLRVAVIDVQTAGLDWVGPFLEYRTPTVWHNAAFDLAHALRARIFRRAARLRDPVKERRKHLEVGRRVARAVAVKPGVAILDIGRIADLGCFAIRHDVDTRRHLTAHVFQHRIGHAGIKGGGVVCVAAFAGEEEIHHLLRARQAADMG
jgi:hypothetical protein